MSERALQRWVDRVLHPASGESPPLLEPVAGDASNRRYYRVQAPGCSRIAVLAPPQTEKNREFAAVRDCLAGAGLRVPSILQLDLEQGFMLLEDLGSELLLPRLDSATADSWYGGAAGLLLKLAAAEAPGPDWPRYDKALLGEELSRFPEWFAGRMLGETAIPPEVFQPFATLLIDSALEQPEVLVHRDFHSRNLMVLPGDELAVIDFQDAVIGPVTYDPVSLWRDCYVRWPAERVRGWALAHLDAMRGQGLLREVSDEQYLRWFDLMGLQRHIKVLGTFARLYLRDNKRGYLADLPLVLRYSREVMAVYAETEPAVAGFLEWFESALEPRIARQEWARA